MVRFIIDKMMGGVQHNAKFTFQYGQIYYTTGQKQDFFQ